MEANFTQAAVFRRDRVTWLAYLTLGFFSYLETLPGPIMPFLQAELQLSYGLASLHFGMFSLGVIAMGVAGANLVAHWGRYWAFWGGALGMGAGAGLLTWSPWVVGTITGAGLMGLAGTLLLVATQAILSDHHGERRTIAFAESNVVAGICAIVASVAVGSLSRTSWGWRSSAGLAVAAVLLLFAFFRQERLDNRLGSAAVRHREESSRLPRRFWVYWVVMLLGSAVEWCVVFWGATFIEQAVGFEKATAATAMSVFFGAIVVGRFTGSRLARSLPSSTLLPLAQGVTLVGFPLFWLASGGVLNLVGLFIAGVGIGNFYPMTLATAIHLTPHLPEQVSARLTLAMGLAGLVAPVLLGWLADQISIQQAYSLVLPLLVMAGVLATLAKYR